MEQMTYTCCRPGYGLRGSSGFGIRALSPGLDVARAQALEPFVTYQPPRGATGAIAGGAPVRLAFLETQKVGRILVHSTYVGRDSTDERRGGNYFSHLVCCLPDGFDALTAAGTWTSAFWQVQDGDEGLALPTVDELKPSWTPQPSEVAEWLADERQHTLFAQVADAFLKLPEGGRVFIAAAPDQVARCVWVLARILPAGWRKHLTFSTYEHDPLNSRARVVGTCVVDSNSEPALPSACFEHPSFALDTYDSRCSSQATVLGYVSQMLEYLAAGDFYSLDELLSLCHDLKPGDLQALDTIPELLGRPDGPVQVDVLRHLHNAALANVLTRHGPRWAEGVVEFALADQAFRKSEFEVIVNGCDRLKTQVQVICLRRVMDAVDANNAPVLQAISLLIPMLSRDSDPSGLAAQVLERIDPQRLCWAARRNFLRCANHVSITPAILRWFRMGREEWQDVGSWEEKLKQRIALLAMIEDPRSADIIAETYCRHNRASWQLLMMLRKEGRCESMFRFARAVLQRNPEIVHDWHCLARAEPGTEDWLNSIRNLATPQEVARWLQEKDLSRVRPAGVSMAELAGIVADVLTPELATWELVRRNLSALLQDATVRAAQAGQVLSIYQNLGTLLRPAYKLSASQIQNWISHLPESHRRRAIEGLLVIVDARWNTDVSLPAGVQRVRRELEELLGVLETLYGSRPAFQHLLAKSLPKCRVWNPGVVALLVYRSEHIAREYPSEQAAFLREAEDLIRQVAQSEVIERKPKKGFLWWPGNGG
jgi:hypothetical protein